VFAQFAELAARHTYLHSQRESGAATRYSYITPAFPGEGAQVQQTLRDSLVKIMSEERAQAFWQQADETFRRQLGEFGAARKEYSLSLGKQGTMELSESFDFSDGSRSSYLGLKTIPASLKPIVQPIIEAWQAVHGAQTGDNSK
jgi:hypothetical protein